MNLFVGMEPAEQVDHPFYVFLMISTVEEALPDNVEIGIGFAKLYPGPMVAEVYLIVIFETDIVGFIMGTGIAE